MTKNDLKVGLFVLMGLVLAGVVIFLIGDERRVFDTSVHFSAKFKDVEGLKSGAPIRMGGVRVGQVAEVRFSQDSADEMVHVDLRVAADEARRIKSDGRAKIVNKGLLGDKMLVIESGTASETLRPGSEISAGKDQDLFGRLDGMAVKAEGAIDDVSGTLEDVRKVAKKLANDDLHRDLAESVEGVNRLLQEINTGRGYPNRLLTDPKEAERISNTVAAVSNAADELKYTLREVRLAVRQVRKGPGFAHSLIYGDGPEKPIRQVGMAAEEMAITLRGVREGDGFMRDVLFGGNGDTRDAISNITQMTADLRDIVQGVRQGKGTVGALLMDPSVYEDMKRVLGNVERNNVLRAIVRYSLKKDQPAPRPQVETVAKDR
ncbi:MAG: MlaD family protein [Myxococcota bacterium]